jgi:hypothetical protein
VLVYFANVWFGTEISGLMDNNTSASLDLGKFASILEHLWIQ